jgi:starch phosphorylase
LKFVDDKDFQEEFLKVKYLKKKALADKIYSEQKLEIDPNSIFDIQVKRLHEYKRQLMNALHIMSMYNTLKANPEFKKTYVPHTYIFGAKAAGTYYFAKKVIKLINTIAKKVNNDPDTLDYLKVVFVENYNVTYAETIMPAADISEQISTASKEASGTGNMKFMMNGALTLGTLDGANVEINELVGEDNIFVFGLESDEVNNLYKSHTYNPKEIYENDSEIRILLDQLVNGFFEDVDRYEFKEIFDNLVYRDQYFVLKDYQAYKNACHLANESYKDKHKWAKKALINIAKSGVFSSDRSIQDYANTIWHVNSVLKG